MKKRYGIIAIGLFILVTACSQRPAEIHYQQDECAQCRMMISDERFAAQLVTGKGKVYKFDSIECLATYYREHDREFDSAALWVTDFSDPGNWIAGRKASYVKSDVIKSPMGANLLAVENPGDRKQHLQEYPGEPLQWSDVQSMIR